MKTQKHRFSLLAVAAIAVLAAGCQGESQRQGSDAAVPAQTVDSAADAKIEFTEVPHADCGGPNRSESIAGKVTGVPPGQYRLVIYAMACNGTLYVQPTSAAPLISIDNGSFDSYIHLGETYYGLLVRPTFKPKAELTEVPQRGGDIVLVAKVRGREPEGGGKKN